MAAFGVLRTSISICFNRSPACPTRASTCVNCVRFFTGDSGDNKRVKPKRGARRYQNGGWSLLCVFKLGQKIENKSKRGVLSFISFRRTTKKYTHFSGTTHGQTARSL